MSIHCFAPRRFTRCLCCGVIQAQRDSTAPCGSAAASDIQRSVPAIENIPRTGGSNRLGTLRRSKDRRSHAAAVVFCDDLVLLAGALSGVLLRPNAGELP